jgi:RimJ/RimL family protein N-acetyltransferase
MAHPANAWTGKLVRLRAVEPGDSEHFHAFDSDTEMQRLGYEVQLPRSAHRAAQWAVEQAERQPAQANGSYGWVVEEVATGEIAGHLNVHGADPRNGNFEYGLSLGEQFRNRGYGAEAVKLMLRFYFDELRYHRVSAIVYAFNVLPQRFHENFGFVLEGRIREYHYTAGRFHDALWYGLTCTDFWSLYPEMRIGPYQERASTLEL